MSSESPAPDPQKKNQQLYHFIRAFFGPTILGKIAVLYFGLNYSQYPGDGYGYGLILSVVVTVGLLIRFVYKYRHVEDL